MKTEIDAALAPLVGLSLLGAGRHGGLLQLQFGGRNDSPAGRNGAGVAGRYTLHVSCSWRLASADGILTGSGDYFTPADPEADPDGFDWEEPGGNWCDVRLNAFMTAVASEPPRVASAVADIVGGMALNLAGDLTLAVFPDSSHTEHVETEFWRLLEPGDDVLPLVVSSDGVDRVAGSDDD